MNPFLARDRLLAVSFWATVSEIVFGRLTGFPAAEAITWWMLVVFSLTSVVVVFGPKSNFERPTYEPEPV